jgi:hypothetical protein
LKTGKSSLQVCFIEPPFLRHFISAFTYIFKAFWNM